MSEVTPTTFVIRQVWKNMTRRPDVALSEFDRWLESVRSEAWDDGVSAAHTRLRARVGEDGTIDQHALLGAPANPYRSRV